MRTARPDKRRGQKRKMEVKTTAATLTKISHNISYMKISYIKSLYGIETNFIYEMLCENFIYEIFHI